MIEKIEYSISYYFCTPPDKKIREKNFVNGEGIIKVIL